jgi:ethanolamine utilization microcompartment shell protein EutL
MKYTVIWRPGALQELADIWLRATNRPAVNQAVHRIDAYLQQGGGNQHWEGTKIIIAPPLVVLYEVDAQDRKASVLSVAVRPVSRGA